MSDRAEFDVTRLVNLAESVLRNVFTSVAFTLKIINGGTMTHTLAVRTERGERFIMRIYPLSRAFVVDYEPDLIKRVRGASRLVPEVIVDSRDGPAAEFAYMLYREIEGSTLQDRLSSIDATQLTNIAEQTLEFLNILSGIPITGFGQPVSGTRAEHATAHAFFRRTFEEASLHAAESRGAPTRWRSDFAAISSRLDSLDGPTLPSFAWSDLSPENIILNCDDKVAGYVDFEGCIACEPSLALGFAYARAPDSPFVRALCTASDFLATRIFSLNFYAALRVARIVPFLSVPLPTGKERDPIDRFFPGADRALQWLSNPDVWH